MGSAIRPHAEKQVLHDLAHVRNMKHLISQKSTVTWWVPEVAENSRKGKLGTLG